MGDEYFELLDKEDKYLELLSEGVGLGVVGALVGRGVAQRIAAKTGMDPKKAEKFKNLATVGGAAAGYKGKKIAQAGMDAMQRKKDDARMMAKNEGKEEVSEVVIPIPQSTKGKLAVIGGLAAAGGGIYLICKKRHPDYKDKDKKKYKECVNRWAMRSKKEKEERRKQKLQKEDSFARMTARATGGFAGKAKKVADAARRAKAFDAARKAWAREG